MWERERGMCVSGECVRGEVDVLGECVRGRGMCVLQSGSVKGRGNIYMK